MRCRRQRAHRLEHPPEIWGLHDDARDRVVEDRAQCVWAGLPAAAYQTELESLAGKVGLENPAIFRVQTAGYHNSLPPGVVDGDLGGLGTRRGGVIQGGIGDRKSTRL